MKSYLPFIALMGLLFYTPNLLAQCDVSNPIVSNVSRTFNTNGTGTCTLKFDLDFTMQNNNGNKVVIIHLWPGTSYPSPILVYSKPPSASDLTASYGTIVIDNGTTATYLSDYPFGTGVTILPTDPEIGRTENAGGTSFQFHISGITIINASCSDIINIKGDIWATNSGSLNSNTKPQCSNQNLSLQIGDPTLTQPMKICDAIPRYLRFGISTQSTSLIPVSYQIYKDDGFTLNNDPVFNPSKDENVTIGDIQTVNISKTQTFNGEHIDFEGGDVLGENSEYWVLITYSDGSSNYSFAKITTSACAALPVKFADFTATRSKNTVLLKWQTATESNNRGFYVQRLLGSGEWKNIAYVFSQADNGNSTTLLNYTYTDLNTYSGLTQYRIVQQDLDYRMHYSEIRAVRGEDNQSGLLVFPNPSQDGKVMLVFGEPGVARDLTVTDLSGRTVKVMRSVTNTTVTLDNLVSGVYTAHVTNLANASTTVEKIVVTKR